ncbi:MAG: tyrosine-type recombinase/integrase [Thermodesulfovibrionales bacterium]
MPYEAMPMRDPTAYLTAEDVARMIDDEPELRNKLIIRLLFRGGMRVSEMSGDRVRKKDGTVEMMQGLLIKDVLYDESCVIIPWEKRKVAKGQPKLRRKIPLDSGTMQMIKEWLLWREEFKYRLKDPRVIPLDRRTVYWVVRHAAERVGIDAIGDVTSEKVHHVHPHTMRHSNSVHRVSQTGGDYNKLRAIQIDLGHKDISTTAGYLSVSPKELHNRYDEDWKGVK